MARRLKNAMVEVEEIAKQTKTDVLTLGARHEIIPYDFTELGAGEIEEVVEFIHAVAYVELIGRPLLTMADWSPRTVSMFLRHRMNVISDIMSLDLRQINRLVGCGHKTRQEVYNVFCEYGMKLDSWMPGHYWARMNYQFKDEYKENIKHE